MRNALNFWKDISISKRLYFVVGVMAVLIACELLALQFAMRNLSATRAFVGGEGLWSKAQKNAAINLQRYAVTRDEADYAAFLENLKVPEGDHLARMEMQKPHPDLKLVRQGFLQGHLHPDDIGPVINLFLRFHWVGYLKRAIAVWAKADLLMEEFKQAGVEYHDALVKSDQVRSVRALGALKKLNLEMTHVEDEFSYVLGEGSRWLEYLLLTILCAAVMLVESIGLSLTFITGRSISRELAGLNLAAKQIGAGHFEIKLPAQSKDEIGQLSRTVNEMGQALQKSYQELEWRVGQRTSELAQSRDQLEVILKGITDGITVIDAQGTFIFANLAAAQMCGFASEALFTQRPAAEVLANFEVKDEAGRPMNWENFPTTLAFSGIKHPAECICRFHHKSSQQERWAMVNSTPLFNDQGQVQMVVTIFKDFTAHKVAEENAKFLDDASVVLSSSLELQKTLDNLLKLIVPRFADWGSIYLMEEEGQLPIRMAVARPGPQKKLWDKFLNKKYPLNGAAKSGPVYAMRTGNSELQTEVSLTELLDNSGDPEQATWIKQLGLQSMMSVPLAIRGKTFGAITFISTQRTRRFGPPDLKLAEDLALRASTAIDNALLYQKAQRAVLTRDEFLSIASHELKTPLTSLGLQIQLAKLQLDRGDSSMVAPTKLAKFFDLSDKQVKRLTALIEDLLDISRIRAGKFSFDFEKGHLSEVISEMMPRFSQQLAKAKCTLQTQITSGIIGSFDQARMEQVIDNLISNAIKYAPGSTLRVALYRQQQKVILEVQDNGPGIPLERQSKIFERFERASSINISGLGLGLFIVKEIVKGHGGTISLQSTTNSGTRLTISMPLERQIQNQPQGTSAQDDRPAGQL